MNRSLLAILTGATAAAALVAAPLLHQRGRLAEILTQPVMLQEGLSPRPAPDPNKIVGVLPRWKEARGSGSKSDGELRAAESVQHLTAAECRAAAETAVAAGDKAPLSDLLGRWASLDGAAAFAWLDRHPDLVELVINDAGPAWAASDPAGFAQWLLSYQPGEGRGYKTSARDLAAMLAPYDLCAAVRISVEKDPHLGASLYCNQLELGRLLRSPRDAEALGAELAAHPEWFNTTRGIGGPKDILPALRSCWENLDPNGCARWLDGHPELVAKAYPLKTETGGYLLPAARPEAAADRLVATAPPEERRKRMNAVIVGWAENDLNAAGEWLAVQPDAPDKWKAVRTFAVAAVKEDPQAAMQWADSIPDPAEHARTQRRVFAKWADTDPAAAAAWLRESGWRDSQLQAARDILVSAAK